MFTVRQLTFRMREKIKGGQLGRLVRRQLRSAQLPSNRIPRAQAPWQSPSLAMRNPHTGLRAVSMEPGYWLHKGEKDSVCSWERFSAGRAGWQVNSTQFSVTKAALPREDHTRRSKYFSLGGSETALQKWHSHETLKMNKWSSKGPGAEKTVRANVQSTKFTHISSLAPHPSPLLATDSEVSCVKGAIFF